MTGFGACVAPDGLRVALHPADEEALAAMHSWLAEALADGGASFARTGDASAVWLAMPPDGSTPVVVKLGGESIGYAAFRRDRTATVVTALAIAPHYRNRGYGAEAVFAIERLSVDVSGFRGLVPVRNGLAVYFWLRVGYRPVFASQHGLNGLTVMERTG